MSAKVAKFPKRRAFEAASVNMLTADWPTWIRRIDVDLRYGLETLRARSRHEAQNNSHVKHFLRLAAANIVGPHGVRLQSKAQRRNGRADEAVRRAVEDAWQRWGAHGACDVTGRLSWLDVQNICIHAAARDGEVLLRLVKDFENEHRFAVQCIDAALLDVTLNSHPNGNGNVIVMGVELNRWRRPVAYHLKPDDPSVYSSEYRRGDHIRVPADQIVHAFPPEWAAQTRGAPWLHAALLDIQHTDAYEEAAVVAARKGASSMGFYKRGEMAADLTDDDGKTKPGVIGAGVDTQGTPYEEFQAGSMSVLPFGWEFQGWDPSFPNVDHQEFIKPLLRSFASGVGAGYNTVANDYEGVNYTSLRASALAERDCWMMLQSWFIGAVVTPIYNAWLMSAMDAAAIRINDRPTPPERLADAGRVRFQPRRWGWVDPLKDEAAAREAVALRTRSVSSVIRERGEDPDEVWAELADDTARLAELGIPLPTAPAATAPAATPPAPTAPPDTDEDDDDTA